MTESLKARCILEAQLPPVKKRNQPEFYIAHSSSRS